MTVPAKRTLALLSNVHVEVLEHLQRLERECVLHYLDLLRERLCTNLREVHLFGSFARGDAWCGYPVTRMVQARFRADSGRAMQQAVRNLVHE